MKKHYGWLGVIPLLIIFSVALSQSYANLLRPLFEAVLPIIYDRLDVLSIATTEYKSQWFYTLSADNSQPLHINGQTLPSGLGASSQTLIAHSMQHLIFFGSTVAIGLTLYRLQLYRLLVLIPVMVLWLEVIDIPFVLVGAVEDLLLFHTDPSAVKTNPYVVWMNLLTNGGRIALSITMGWITVVLTRKPLRVYCQ